MSLIVLVADPPWRFRDRVGTRGAEANYRTMAIHDLCGMPLPECVEHATDSVLFLWRVSSMQREALDLVEAGDIARIPK